MTLCLVVCCAVDALDGGPSEEERAAAAEAAAEELSARQVAATVLLGRLVAHRCLPAAQQQWLATQLVTLLVSGHEQVRDWAHSMSKPAGFVSIWCTHTWSRATWMQSQNVLLLLLSSLPRTSWDLYPLQSITYAKPQLLVETQFLTR
jgi:hypothetical protein